MTTSQYLLPASLLLQINLNSLDAGRDARHAGNAVRFARLRPATAHISTPRLYI